MLHIIFGQSQALLSLIKYVVKDIKSMLLESSWNILSNYTFGIVDVDIFCYILDHIL
jgi:hypothetical protein